MGYFFSLTLQGHIFNATQGKWPIKQFSRFYMANVLELNSTTMVGDKTPIQYAIMNYGTLTDRKINNLKPVVELLVKEGVDINANSTYGLTSLHYAIMDEDPKAVEFLIAEKANVDQPVRIDAIDQMVKPSQIDGMTPLRFLEERRQSKLVKNTKRVNEIEKLLIAAGATLGEKTGGCRNEKRRTSPNEKIRCQKEKIAIAG
jgi:ankyrin repeat protein